MALLWASKGVASRTGPLGRLFATVSSSDDTHSDFKPKYKEEAVQTSDVASIIKKDISSNAVFVYMKGSPDAPSCGFSNMACRVLDAYGK